MIRTKIRFVQQPSAQMNTQCRKLSKSVHWPFKTLRKGTHINNRPLPTCKCLYFTINHRPSRNASLNAFPSPLTVLVPTFADREVSRGQRGGSPTVVNLSFLGRSRYFFFQVASHLSSQELSGPRSRPTTIQEIL
jgi:hypothetical protein